MSLPRDEKGVVCAFAPRRTRAPYKSRLYHAGIPRQHEESSLGVNARATRNHIRHEQAASPREFMSARVYDFAVADRGDERERNGRESMRHYYSSLICGTTVQIRKSS